MNIRGAFLVAIAILQCVAVSESTAAESFLNPFSIITPDWARDVQGKVPIKVLNRDSGTVVLDGLPPNSLQLDEGRYTVSASHLYGAGKKRLRFIGFFRVSKADLTAKQFSYTIELIGEHSLFGRWLDNKTYKQEQRGLLAKQAEIRRTKADAARLADEVRNSLSISGVNVAFDAARRLHRQYKAHESTHEVLAVFNKRVCELSTATLTSTWQLQAAKDTLAKHQGEAECTRDVQSLIDEVDDILALENSAATEVHSGKYVQAYALFGQIKRDFGHLIDPVSLNSNLKELLKPLQGQEDYKPKLIRLDLQR